MCAERFCGGEDHLTGKNYTHRKQWVIDRLSELESIYAIDICAYAIMSNHYHLVLRVDAEQADKWSDIDVIDRWSKLFNIPILIHRYLLGETSAAENEMAIQQIALWRERLKDISWFMRSLNEFLARKANKEDNCKGRFWEGRFKSQALLDEAAVLTCMSYVDLNPVRAGIASTPETSDYTSIQQRIKQWKLHIKPSVSPEVPIQLVDLTTKAGSHVHDMPFALHDYLQLVDWAGRTVREGKRGYIPENTPPILIRLNLDPKIYLQKINSSKHKLSQPIALGAVKALQAFVKRHKRKFLRKAIIPTFN